MNRSKVLRVLCLAALVLGGLFLILYPHSTLSTAVRILGGALTVYGAIGLISYLVNRPESRPSSLVAGAAALIFGVIILLRPNLILNFFPTVAGILIVVTGILQLMSVLEGRRADPQGRWWLPLILALITVVLGVVLLLNPFGAMSILIRMLGATLMYIGITGFIALFL